MPAPNPVQRLARLGLTVTSKLAFLAPLLTRLTVGYTFFFNGRGKLRDPEVFQNLVKMIEDRGIPLPVVNAYFVSGVEFFGSMLVVLGLATRLVSVLLAGVMIVALNWGDFLASWNPDATKGPTDFIEWVLLGFLVWLILHGPGAVSADALVKRWLFGAATTTAAAKDPGA
jgi:putative oxidoreductase